MNELKHIYTDDIHNKRIIILGPTPPPLGGVSVHVQRVIAKLKKQANHVIHFNTCREFRYRFFYMYLLYLFYFLMKYKPHELHLHTLYLSNGLCELRFIIWLKKILKFDVILIEHDCRYLYKQSKSWKDNLNRLMPYIKKHIYIGSRTAQSFQQNSIIPARIATVESAFLPPDEGRRKEIMQTYPKEIFNFIADHDHLLLGNAFALSLIDGKDLYGFDQSIDALYQLRKKNMHVGLIFVLGQMGDKDYFAQCMQRIELLALQDHIYILSGQKELWPLIKIVDVFVRPTLSDGASVSIEEALWCGKPVVTTDVCWRPKEALLFKSGDVNDFVRALSQLLVD